jgi:hypothetical protein
MLSKISPKISNKIAVKYLPSLLLAMAVGGTFSAAAIASESKFSNSPSFKIAQLFRQNTVLRAGEAIEVTLNSNDVLYVNKGERKPAELRVNQDVISENGIILIPEGAIIVGEFRPVAGGAKFVAQTLTSRGGTVRMSAESGLINDVKDPRETGATSILGDAGIGAVAGALLGGLFGGRSILATENILGGAAAGVVVGNVTAPQVVVIDPSTPLNIITRRNLTFRTQDRFN